MENLKKPISLFISSILLMVLVATLMAFPIMWLWNSCLVPAVDGVNLISHWQALGLNFLFSILFKPNISTNNK